MREGKSRKNPRRCALQDVFLYCAIPDGFYTDKASPASYTRIQDVIPRVYILYRSQPCKHKRKHNCNHSKILWDAVKFRTGGQSPRTPKTVPSR